jgi:hypothetical protein
MTRAERALGNASRADSLQAEARTVLEYIVAHMPPEFRDSFLNLSGVRAVFDPTLN